MQFPPLTRHLKENKHIQISVRRMGIEPTITALERAKTVHFLTLSDTVIGTSYNYQA
jgi:hypothetical protein